MAVNEIEDVKAAFVQASFIHTADQNYLVGRHALWKHLTTDGFWLAAHAVEKYLKAALLLNGKSSRGYSHNLLKLFDAYIQIAGDHIQDSFAPPKTVAPPLMPWEDQTLRAFMGVLNTVGDPDNRYQLTGYLFSFHDILRLDQLVYFVRRTCRYLKDEDRLTDPMFWEINSKLPLERIIRGQEEHLSDMLLDGNVIWSTVANGGKPVGVGMKPSFSMQMGALNMMIKDLERMPVDQLQTASDELIRWIDLNVQMSKQKAAALKQTVRQVVQRKGQPGSPK